MSTVNGFQVGSETLKYNYESLDNYNTPNFSTSSSKTYAVGDYVMYNGKLYKCTTATTGGTWVSGSWALAVLSDDVSDLNHQLSDTKNAFSLADKKSAGLIDCFFEQGGIYIGNGIDYSSDKNIRTGMITVADGEEIYVYPFPVPDDCEIWVHEYTDATTYKQGYKVTTTSFTPTTTLIRIRLTTSSSAVITPSNVPVVFSTEYGFLFDKISSVKSQLETELEEGLAFDYVSATSGRIPILYLSGDISEMTKEHAVPLNYLFTEGNRSGTCTLKWQGASSVNNPKKNYTIKFDVAFETHGWGVQKKYVLKGYYTDFSHARDVCGAKLWGQIVRNRMNTVPTEDLAPFDKKIEGLYNGSEQLYNGTEPLTVMYSEVWQPNGGAVDGFPIVVVMNDEYIGLYTFNVPKDAWMMGMDEGYSNTECILTAEAVTPATRLMATAELDGSDWEVEYVSNDDDSWVATSFNGAIQDAIDCDSAEDYEALKSKFDMYSAIDYYLFSLLTANWDGIGHNYFMFTYDGTKWYHGAYDMDNLFGYQWHGYSTPSFVKVVSAPLVTGLNNAISGCQLFKLVITYDRATLKSRYATLRGGVLSEANIFDTVYNFVSPINKSIYDQEVLIWEGIPASETNNVAQIMEFYNMRAKYMDSVIESL